ncbi:MAG: hypothetical protein J7642_09175 [Cyanobacteria bacterium SBC]|nr:hypothetical protein [Cyanobacteria bacterium SBC]
MKKTAMKAIGLSAAVLTLTGCSAAMVPDLDEMGVRPASSADSPMEPSATTTTLVVTSPPEPVKTGKFAYNGWEFRLTDWMSPGTSYLGKSVVYETSETWVVVSVGVKNTNRERREAREAPFFLFLAKLLDETGNEYGVTEIDYKYDLAFSEKPFASGEVRSMDLLFEMPADASVSQLVVETTDARNPVQIQLSR